MQKVYVPLKKDMRHHTNFERSLGSTVLLVMTGLAFVVLSFLMRGVFNEQREELIEKLGREREVSRINEKLKVELAGITRGRYIELKAKERLGLKRATEDEVLVLRHE